MAPRISVITGTYNRENMLPRAIESVLNQTWSDFELIVVDNGSIDKSGQIADEFAAKDKRIRVLHLNPNSGPAGAYNAGLEAACGDYVAYVDDDDWIEPDYLEFLYEMIRANHADIAISGSTGKRALDEKAVLTGEEAVLEMLNRRRINTTPGTKLIRRELMQDIRFPDGVIACDAAVMYKILAGAEKVAYHGLPKYTFGYHDDNASGWVRDHSLLTPKILEEAARNHRERTVWLSEKFPDRADEFHYFELSYKISMVEKIERLGLTHCTEQLELMKQQLCLYKEMFLKSPLLKDFEREWMEQYIG